MTYEIERAFLRYQIEQRELAGDPKTAKSIAELREEMEERHGLAWPAAVIEAMAGRPRWRGFVRRIIRMGDHDGHGRLPA